MLRFRILTIALVASILLSCKETPIHEVSLNDSQYATMEINCIPPARMSVLAPYEAIEEAFGVPRTDTRIVENGHDNYRVKGFVMWDIEGDYDNRGIYISQSRNKYESEGQDFVSQMVSGLKGFGERDSDGNVEVYEDWVDIGDDSAHSPVSHTYVWQVKNCLLFKMVFNLPYDDDAIANAAPIIAQQLTDQYLEKAAQ